MIFGFKFRRAILRPQPRPFPVATHIPNGMTVPRHFPRHIGRAEVEASLSSQDNLPILFKDFVGSVDGDSRTITNRAPTGTMTSAAPARFAARIMRATSASVIWSGRRDMIIRPVWQLRHPGTAG